MKNTLEQIKLSPIFNFSLSSKELFHSNFLFWLCKESSTKNIVGSYFARKLEWANENLELILPERETENIDLMFELLDKNQQKRKIVIENKVKSLPYQGQLIEYAKSFSDENTGLILLSLSKPDFIKNGCYQTPDGYTWRYLSYMDIVELLEELLSFASIQPYHSEIIADYKRLILLLTEIESNCNIQQNELFNFSSNQICTLLRDKEVKLHDLYLKKKHEQFALIIHREIKNRYLQTAAFGTVLKWNDDKIISVWHGMTRSEGLTDIKIKINDQLILGIQLQGIQYRLYAEFPAGVTTAQTTLEKLSTSGFFSFSKASMRSIYPKKGGYNKFGTTFFYRYIRVNDLTVWEVTQEILKDVDRIIQIRSNKNVIR